MADRSSPRELMAIYGRLLAARIRAEWQYRASFLLYSLAQALAALLDLAAIVVLFEHVPELAGWSLAEVAFLYGASGVSFQLAEVFVGPVERAAQYIRRGTFDDLLVRPLGALFQLSSREFELRRAAKLVQAAVVLVVAANRLDQPWSLGRMGMAALIVLSGAVIFGAVWIATAAISFWTVETQEIANSFTYGGSFLSQYPMDVFAGWLRRLLLVVPLAFVTYVPTAPLLGHDDVFGLPAAARFASPLVAGAVAGLAWLAWRTAIRHYRSTGS